MDSWSLTLVAVVSLFVLVGAIWDYRFKKLPNWLTVPGFAVGVLFHAVRGVMVGGWWGLGSELLDCLGGFATGFGILLVMWLVGTGGAGDVKLMGALGAWLGTSMILKVFFVSTMFVVIGSVGVLAYAMITAGMERTKQRYLKNAGGSAGNKNSSAGGVRDARVQRRLMPYGVPVALATWVVLAWSLTAAG
ncbi:MAG: prepilin peptidase [Planctomycetaceae bacterium]|nr:prepilin peptidase [Planctomycetaceae bacterium]